MTNEVGKNEQTHEGRCLCGAIRFRSVGAPVKTTVCHCPLCQRASGSAFTVELLFLRTAVSFDGAPPSTYTYLSPDHGRQLHYTFCPTCGTRLGVTLERFPALQIIYAGTYNDPSWVKPDSHIFTRSAAAWIHPPDDVDCFTGHMMDEQGKPQQPVPRKV
ncbi:MAG: GFA family protein [Bradyrhizobium sp.]